MPTGLKAPELRVLEDLGEDRFPLGWTQMTWLNMAVNMGMRVKAGEKMGTFASGEVRWK
jgi:hypothetical protein